MTSVEELTEVIRPPATKTYGEYARPERRHRGGLRAAMNGPRKSRADQLLKRF